jgi:hypothetical protein
VEPRVFVSYRREDTAGTAGRLRDRLTQVFGEENVFFDVDSIAPGRDFRDVIHDTLATADAVLVVIGDEWRPDLLARPTDYVRLELAEALEQGKLVVPVLVEGTAMPAPDRLPHELRGLAYLHAAPLRRDPDFHPDATRLVEELRRELRRRTGASSGGLRAGPGKAAWLVAAGALVLVVAGLIAGVALLGGGSDGDDRATATSASGAVTTVETGASSEPAATTATSTGTNEDGATVPPGTGPPSEGSAEGSLELGNDPRGLAVGFSSVWAVITGENSVWRIDPETLEVLEKIPVGNEPQDVVTTPEGVWVSNTADNTIQLIDPETNTPDEPIPVDVQPYDLLATPDTLWVAHVGGQSVIAITTPDNARRRFLFDAPLLSIGVQGEVLWATVSALAGEPYDRVWRLDTTSEESPRELRVGAAEGSRSGELVSDDRDVVIPLEGPDQVVFLDQNGEEQERLPVPAPPRVTLDGNGLWMAARSQTGSEVVWYDRSDLSNRHRVGEPLETEGQVDELVVDGGRLWILVNDGTDRKGSLIRRPITA